MGDLVMLISMISHEISLASIVTFSLLYAFKSFSWILDIKAQKNPNLKMVYSSGTLQILVFYIISTYFHSKNSMSMLLVLEYTLVLLSLFKNQMIMLLDLNNIESNRTLFVSIIKILFLFFKGVAFFFFIISFSINNRFPYGILKSLISTLIALFKKIILLKKYIRLILDLETIKEVEVNGTCAICTDDIVKGKRLQCSHVFHSSCLKMWCEREVSCPICRADLSFRKDVIHETEEEVISGVPIELNDTDL